MNWVREGGNLRRCSFSDEIQKKKRPGGLAKGECLAEENEGSAYLGLARKKKLIGLGR